MSLSSRIIVRLSVTSLIATCVAYGWLYIKQSRVEGYLRQRTLTRQAQEIARFISTNANGEAELKLPADLHEAYNNPDSPYRYVIRDEAGRVVSTSVHDVGALSPPPLDKNLPRESKTNIAEIHSTFPTSTGKRTFTTEVEQTASRSRSLNAAVFNEFVTDGGWLGIPFLIALLCISAYTVKKSLAPLDDLSSRAKKIDPGNSTIRLPDGDIPKEIRPLVRAVNNALDKLDEALGKQREFTANAAHQLRTPLTVLTANIDLMADKDGAARLRPDVDLMTRIVTQLLVVARLESLSIPLDHTVELCSCAQAAAQSLGPIAISTGKSLEVEEPDGAVFVRGNISVVTAAVRNLIENALHHSPVGATVRIRVTAGPPAIEVIDSGAGVPAELREKIFHRFWQGERSERGAGLGLAIVRQIMLALNGSVSVSEAPGGGPNFVLRFPAYNAPAQSKVA